MRTLDRWRRKASQLVDLTPHNYIIVKQIPHIKSPVGFYAIHDEKVWVWVKERHRATPFRSQDLAEHAAKGSMLHIYYDYRIERV